MKKLISWLFGNWLLETCLIRIEVFVVTCFYILYFTRCWGGSWAKGARKLHYILQRSQRHHIWAKWKVPSDQRLQLRRQRPSPNLPCWNFWYSRWRRRGYNSPWNINHPQVSSGRSSIHNNTSQCQKRHSGSPLKYQRNSQITQLIAHTTRVPKKAATIKQHSVPTYLDVFVSR